MRHRVLRIEILTCEGCPHTAPTRQRVREALAADGIHADINEIEIATGQEATSLRFIGSPTVRINGKDVDPASQERTDYGLMCRIYSDGENFGGVPSEALLRQAIRAASYCMVT